MDPGRDRLLSWTCHRERNSRDPDHCALHAGESRTGEREVEGDQGLKRIALLAGPSARRRRTVRGDENWSVTRYRLFPRSTRHVVRLNIPDLRVHPHAQFPVLSLAAEHAHILKHSSAFHLLPFGENEDTHNPAASIKCHVFDNRL